MIAVLLVAIMMLGVVSCGVVNKDAPAVILWSGDGEVKNPNSLINSMERSMYIEKVAYEHKGANGDASAQLAQAKDALNGGCAALLVELINPLDAQEIVNLAKEKNIPVVFFNCLVGDDVIGSYDKCVLVGSNLEGVADAQGEMIAKYIEGNFEAVDRNGDGKISYVSYAGSLVAISAVKKANEILKDTEIKVGGRFSKETVKTELVYYNADALIEGLPALGAGLAQAEIMEKYNDEAKNTVELVITDNDLTALEILTKLQDGGFNTDKLATHLIPIFTVGGNVDYKSYVLAGRPALSDDMKIDEENDSTKVIKEKDKKIKELCGDHYQANRYLVDLSQVAEVDLDDMVYTTVNVIDAGRIAGTVMEDVDAISGAVATVTRNLIKGDDTFAKVDTALVKESTILVPYTVYPN